MEKTARIIALMDPNNWEPNLTRIAEQSGYSLNAVRSWYNKLIDEKLIVKEKCTDRSITIKNLSEAEAEAERREE